MSCVSLAEENFHENPSSVSLVVLRYHAVALLCRGRCCSRLCPGQPPGLRPFDCTAKQRAPAYSLPVYRSGSACLGSTNVSATPRPNTQLRFRRPGDRAAINAIRSMTAQPQRGAAFLLAGIATNPVKILVFGDSQLTPSGQQPGSVFTVRSGNGQPICDRTRSGIMLQTPNGQRGSIVVNGVTINLGSTVYLVPGADLLFDQDPRNGRRNGQRNPDAPLCSGFDSDCNFGRCKPNQRMVWGPYCQSDDYPYIENGLYRVTLYGVGKVEAGATDYGLTGDYYSLAHYSFNLPGSYTFCWEGLEPGGTGFETIVQARQQQCARRPHYAGISGQ